MGRNINDTIDNNLLAIQSMTICKINPVNTNNNYNCQLLCIFHFSCHLCYDRKWRSKVAHDRTNFRNNFREKRFDTMAVAQSVYHPLWYDASQHRSQWQIRFRRRPRLFLDASRRPRRKNLRLSVEKEKMKETVREQKKENIGK